MTINLMKQFSRIINAFFKEGFSESFSQFLRQTIVSTLLMVFFFATHFSYQSWGSPKGFYLEIKLSSIDTGLLSGGHFVSLDFFNSISNQSVWKGRKRYYFDNGFSTVYIGPIISDWSLTEPHSLSITVGNNTATISIDSVPYAIQSHISEKTLAYHDESTIRLVSANSTHLVGIGIQDPLEVTEALTVSGNLQILNRINQIEFSDGLRFFANGSKLGFNMFHWTPFINGGIFSLLPVAIGADSVQGTDMLFVSGNVNFSGLAGSNSATTILVLDSNNRLQARFVHPILWQGLGSIEIPVGHITANASLEVTTMDSKPLIVKFDGSTFDTVISTNGQVTITDSSTPEFLSSFSVINESSSSQIFQAADLLTSTKGLFVSSNGMVSISTQNSFSEFTVSGNVNSRRFFQNGYPLLTNSYLPCEHLGSFFMGGFSGNQFECGNFNTVLGGNSFITQKIGLENTFLGSSIAYTSLFTQKNTSLGSRSSHNLGSGSYNLTVGLDSGKNIVSGIGNIGIGVESLELNDTGDYNIGIGYEAGQSFTSLDGSPADYNIAIGSYSGLANSYGTNNIFIGHAAGNNEQISNKLLLMSTSSSGSQDIFLYGDLEYQSLSIATQSIRANAQDDSVKLYIDGHLEMSDDLLFIDDDVANNPNDTAMNSGRWHIDVHNQTAITLNSRYNRLLLGVATHSDTNDVVVVRTTSGINSRTLQLDGSSGGLIAYGSSIHFGNEDPATIKVEEDANDDLSISSTQLLTFSSPTLNLLSVSNQPNATLHLKIPSLSDSTNVHVLGISSSDKVFKKPYFEWSLNGNNLYYNNQSVFLGTLPISGESSKLYVKNTNTGELLLKLIGESNKGIEMDTDGNITVSGNLTIDGTYSIPASSGKTFIIQHPKQSKNYLIHSTIESPQADVYYRGKGKLVNGKTILPLAPYLSKLIDSSSISLQLTCINGWSPLSYILLDENQVQVISDTPKDEQEFYWTLIATRKNTDFSVEPLKKNLLKKSFGPYSYGISQQYRKELL